MPSPLRRFLYLTPLLICAGCPGAPNFPDTPIISANNVKVIRKQEPGNTILDSISLTVNWTDGDGDLGYLPDDNSNGFNYYTKLYKRKSGTFVEVDPVTANGFNGRFPNLSPDGPTSTKKLKLRGTLSYAFNGPGIVIPGTLGKINGNFEPARAGDVIRFEVYIIDRAGNRSNTITTEEVTL